MPRSTISLVLLAFFVASCGLRGADMGAATTGGAGLAPSAPLYRGRLVDREGRGLADVTVQPFGGFATRFRCERTHTDPDGRFVVPALSCGGRVLHDGEAFAFIGLTFEGTTYACSDGKSWWDVEVPLGRDDPTEHVFVMSQGGALEGRVVDASTGAPLGLGMRLYTGTSDSGGFFRWFESDAQGRFREIGLAPGDYTIDANDANAHYPVLGHCRVEAGATTRIELVAR